MSLNIDDLKRTMASIPNEPGECTYPVYIPQSLYDRAKQEGYDMTNYAPTQAIPMTPSEAYFGGPRLLNHYPCFNPKRKRPWRDR